MVPTSVTLNDLQPKNRRFSEFSGSDRHYISNHEAALQCAMAYYAEYMLVARSFYGSHAKQRFKTLKYSIKNKKNK